MTLAECRDGTGWVATRQARWAAICAVAGLTAQQTACYSWYRALLGPGCGVSSDLIARIERALFGRPPLRPVLPTEAEGETKEVKQKRLRNHQKALKQYDRVIHRRTATVCSEILRADACLRGRFPALCRSPLGIRQESLAFFRNRWDDDPREPGVCGVEPHPLASLHDHPRLVSAWDLGTEQPVEVLFG